MPHPQSFKMIRVHYPKLERSIVPGSVLQIEPFPDDVFAVYSAEEIVSLALVDGLCVAIAAELPDFGVCVSINVLRKQFATP